MINKQRNIFSYLRKGGHNILINGSYICWQNLYVVKMLNVGKVFLQRKIILILN